MLDSHAVLQVAVRGLIPLAVLLLAGQVFPSHTRLRRTLSVVTALYLVVLVPIIALRVPAEVPLLPSAQLDEIFEHPAMVAAAVSPDARPEPTPAVRPLALGEGLGNPPGSPASRRLGLLYAIGVVVLLVMRGAAAIRLHGVVRNAVPLPPDGALRESTATAMRLLKLDRAEVRLSDQVALPFVCGAWHPVVVVPRDAVAWPTERQLNVMLHELAHVRQHDVGWLAVWAVARAMHWFNPLAWIAMRDFRLFSEQLSDAWVVRHTRSAADYAQDLVLLARHRIAMVTLSGALGLAHWSTLSTRIRTILSGTGTPRESRRRTMATVAGYLCVILPAGIITPVPQLPTGFPDLQSTMNLSTSPPDISSNAAGLQARWVEGTLHRGLFVTQDPGYLTIHTGVVPPRGSAMLVMEREHDTEVTTFGPGDRVTLPEEILRSLQRTVTAFQSEHAGSGSTPTPAPPAKQYRPAHRSVQLGLPAVTDDPGLAVIQAGWLQGAARYAIMIRGPWRLYQDQLLPNDSGSWLVLQAVDTVTGATRRVEVRVQDRRLLVNDAPAAMDAATESWLSNVYRVLQTLTPK